MSYLTNSWDLKTNKLLAIGNGAHCIIRLLGPTQCTMPQPLRTIMLLHGVTSVMQDYIRCHAAFGLEKQGEPCLAGLPKKWRSRSAKHDLRFCFCVLGGRGWGPTRIITTDKDEAIKYLAIVAKR